MTNPLRALFPSSFIDEHDDAARAADLARNDFSPHFASKNSVESDCYVDEHSGLIYVRSPIEQLWMSVFGDHDVKLENGTTVPTDTMRVILPSELREHLQADPAFDAAYHHLTGSEHKDGEHLPPPGGQADYHPETHMLLGSGSMDMASPVGGIGAIADHRIADVGPYDVFHPDYLPAERMPGPDLSEIGPNDWQSNYGPCEHGHYVGAGSANIDKAPPVEIPVHSYIEHAFDPPSPDAWHSIQETMPVEQPPAFQPDEHQDHSAIWNQDGPGAHDKMTWSEAAHDAWDTAWQAQDFGGHIGPGPDQGAGYDYGNIHDDGGHDNGGYDNGGHDGGGHDGGGSDHSGGPDA